MHGPRVSSSTPELGPVRDPESSTQSPGPDYLQPPNPPGNFQKPNYRTNSPSPTPVQPVPQFTPKTANPAENRPETSLIQHSEPTLSQPLTRPPNSPGDSQDPQKAQTQPKTNRLTQKTPQNNSQPPMRKYSTETRDTRPETPEKTGYFHLHIAPAAQTVPPVEAFRVERTQSVTFLAPSAYQPIREIPSRGRRHGHDLR